MIMIPPSEGKLRVRDRVIPPNMKLLTEFDFIVLILEFTKYCPKDSFGESLRDSSVLCSAGAKYL